MSKDDKKAQSSIPASKVQRATRFMKTGVKIGGNYVKHYAKKMVDPQRNKETLHEENAEDIYSALSELKGSALKVAQMMSMDKNLLPRQYADKFQMARYSAPPLSYPLVVKTFKKYFDKSPSELFESFTKEAVNAASIGQVHLAELKGKKLAVKVQYPGVANSVSSDLKIVKPFAVNLLQLNEKDVAYYMTEVEEMLLSETDYELELERSLEITKACAHLPNLRFPQYYPELSSKRVLTMDWMEGMHLDQFAQAGFSQEIRNKVGQALWDFYDFQIHQLHAVHADPHPGNFILDNQGALGVIDFGCVKRIPMDYYKSYCEVLDPNALDDDEHLYKVFYELNFIYEDDSTKDKEELFQIFKTLIGLLSKPFYEDTFDFGHDAYFDKIYEFGEATSENKLLKKSKKPRGSRHGLYINRTYFGLYAMLNQLKANIKTQSIKNQ